MVGVTADIKNAPKARKLAPRIFLGVALSGFAYSMVRLISVDTGAEANLAAQQALAFMQGHLDIRTLTPLYDIAYVDGHYYSVFPPFPAVLLMPFVFIFGLSGTKSALIAIALTLVGSLVLFRTLEYLGLRRDFASWLAAAFFLGTGYWFLLLGSRSVYMFSQVVAVTFSLLALYLLIKPRPSVALSGLCLGLAFLSRQMTLYLVIFLIAYLWVKISGREWSKFRKSLIFLLLPVSGCLLAYFAFNAARFGSPFETGYRHIVLTTFLKDRVDSHGLFSIAYIPFNFQSMFFNGFQVEFGGRDVLQVDRISPWGTSILVASPFILTAFYAKEHKTLNMAAWTAIGLIVFHTLCYYNNGWVQANTNRFTMDFLPLLMVLCALGMKSAPPILWKAGVIWAITLNFIAHVVLSLMGVGYLDVY